MFSSYRNAWLLLTSLKACDWSGHIFGASANPRSSTKQLAVSPSSAVHSGQHDTRHSTGHIIGNRNPDSCWITYVLIFLGLFLIEPLLFSPGRNRADYFFGFKKVFTLTNTGIRCTPVTGRACARSASDFIRVLLFPVDTDAEEARPATELGRFCSCLSLMPYSSSSRPRRISSSPHPRVSRSL